MDFYDFLTRNSRKNSSRSLDMYEITENGDSYDFEFDEVAASGLSIEQYADEEEYV